jgi:hypothetical protein
MAQEFEVITQQHDWTFDTNGNRLGQWTITFRTPSGVESQVIVPDESYTPEVVGPLIAHEAALIEQVQHLQRAEPAHHRPAQLGHTQAHHATHTT